MKRKEIQLHLSFDTTDEIQSDWFLKALERIESEFSGEWFHVTGGYRILEGIPIPNEGEKAK